MPMENMVHMFGGGEKKSTLVDEKVIWFPREDDASPRQKILTEFCNAQVRKLSQCMVENGQNEANCLQPKGFLDKCASAAFKEVNSNPKWIF